MPNRRINFSPIFSPHLVTNPPSPTLKHKFKVKTFLYVAICVIFCSILCFIFSVLRLHQLFLLLSREKSFTKFHLFLIPSFPNISLYDLTSATFNEKNYNSSSLIPSLLFVFEVKVDYVEGYSRMIIYDNYVEVLQLCMAKKRSTQLVFHLQPFYSF